MFCQKEVLSLKKKKQRYDTTALELRSSKGADFELGHSPRLEFGCVAVDPDLMTVTMFDFALTHCYAQVTEPTEPLKKKKASSIFANSSLRPHSSWQPTHQCSSRVRLSPSLTRVISLSCGHNGSSSESSESSEEVRTDQTQPFVPFPVVSTTLTPPSITNLLLLRLSQLAAAPDHL